MRVSCGNGRLPLADKADGTSVHLSEAEAATLLDKQLNDMAEKRKLKRPLESAKVETKIEPKSSPVKKSRLSDAIGADLAKQLREEGIEL